MSPSADTLLVALLTQPDLAAARDMLAQHPELMTDMVMRLARLTAASRHDRDERERLERVSDLIRKGMEKGLDAAYAELTAAPKAAPQGFQLMALGMQFLRELDDATAIQILEQYPEIPLDAVRVSANLSLRFADEEEKARLTRRIEMLDQWPMLKFMLASRRAQAAEARMRSERSFEALRELVSASEQAIAASDAAPVEPAMKASLLGHTMQLHYSVWASSREAASLDRAVECGLQAEQLVAGSSGELLATLLVSRYEASGDKRDLDRAVAHLALILPGDTFPSGDQGLGAQASTLANALRHRYLASGERSDIDRAIALYERLAALRVDDAARRWIRQLNLAAGLLTRYDSAGDLHDLDRGIEIMQAALGAWSDETEGKDTVANNLALALTKRFVVTKSQDDVEQAIKASDVCVRLLRPGAPQTRRNLTTSASANLLGYRELHRGELLDAAVKTANRAIEHLEGGTIDAARALQFASTCLLERFALTPSRDDIDRAVDLARRAIEAAAASMPMRAGATGQLAQALRRRSESEWSRPSDLTEAITSYRAAVPDAMSDSPLLAIELGIDWGGWASNREAWSEAADALLLAMDAHQHVLDSQRDRQARELRSKRVQGLGALAAMSLVRCGDLERAAVTLERGRGLLMAQALHIRPDEVTLASIQQKAAGVPLVYLEDVDGGCALIVEDGGVTTLELPELKETTINTWLAANINLRLSDSNEWERKLQQLCRWLWDVAMGPIVDQLKPHTHMTLIPGGYLAMLPLHAAWTEDKNSSVGRRHALDVLTIRYAPSACALRPRKPSASASLLCVDEPAPVDAAALPYSEAEVKAASAHFKGKKVLRGRAATREAVIDGIGRRQVLHLSCHGTARLHEPLDSGLLLSGNEMLTLRDFLGMSFEHVDLAVLSACDTGQMGTTLPDEAVGLPGGLLQAGARGVVSTLWPITSFATLLLMARFYEYLRDDKLPPADALGSAQRWLRDTTNQEKSAHFRKSPAIHRELLMLDPDARDHATLSSWAAFCYCGV